jgi:hypothetical protein
MNEIQGGQKLLTADDIRELSALPVSAAAEVKDNSFPTDTVPVAAIPDSIEEKVYSMPFNKRDYNILIAEALMLQLKADSLSRIARDQRILARETPDNETKKQMVADILRYEREAKQTQREADEKFLAARKMKNEADTIPAADSNLSLYNEINGIRVYQYNLPDSATRQNNNFQTNLPASPVSQNNPPSGKRDEFEILSHTPYNDSNPIPALPMNIPGLIYRIQLGVFSKPRETNSFGGIFPLYAEWIEQRGLYKYYAGGFYTSESVSGMLEKVRRNGFPDAFVVAFMDSQPVSTEKAREIEFENLKLQH